MQITSAHSLLASLNLRGIIKAKFTSFSLLFLVRNEFLVTAFWGYPAEKKSVVSRGLRGKTLSVHLEICTPVYLVPFQNVNFSKTQTSEKKGVFSEGSAVIPGLAGADWNDWQMPHLL